MMKRTCILFALLQLLSNNLRALAFQSVGRRHTPSSLAASAFSNRLFTSGGPSRHSEDQHHGVNHRHSAADWYYNVRSINQSEILQEVRGPVSSVATWSFVVSLIHKMLLQSPAKAVAHKMCIPGTVHSFLVSALGLLLVFRTNSAYQRFYEGRKIWEDILSVSRNLSRMVQLYGKEVEQSRKSSILKTVAAFPYLLRNHIRPGCLCKTVSVDPSNPPAHMMELREYSTAAMETRHEGDKTATSLRASECWVDKRDVPWTLIRSSSRSGEECLDDVAVAYNRPLWVCDRIGKLVMEVPYSSNFSSRERLVLLNSVDKLTNAIGQCERIHQTAVPLNYARHSLRSLTLWLFTLPFALIGDLGLLTAPVTGCIAWIFFGVYQIGYSIEDPFQGSLRLSNLCDAIRYDVLECEKSRLDTVATQDALYKPLGFIDDEDVFLQATPKLVQTNGTWDLVDVAKGSS